MLRGDPAAAVADLKQQPGRELQIHGSTTLGRFLLAAGLVDELRLVVAPVIVGDGRRLFQRSEHSIGLRLEQAITTPAGLAVHTYMVDGSATFDSYDPVVHTYSPRPERTRRHHPAGKGTERLG